MEKSEKLVLEAVSEAAMLRNDLPNVGEAGLFTLNMFRAQHPGLACSYQIVQ